MPASTALAVIPRRSSWPVPSVDELADALFEPGKDWQKAELIIERGMKHRRAGDQFAHVLITLIACHLPAIVDLHRSELRQAHDDPLFPPGRFLHLPSFVLSALKTEYFAKFIRDSPVSVGHGLMLEELRSIERSLRGPLKFLKAEVSRTPLPDRAHKALAALSGTAYRLLFIWVHLPRDARRSLAFDRRKNTSLLAVLVAFSRSQKKRPPHEYAALQAELGSKGNAWTEGMIELPFLTCLAEGDVNALTELSDIFRGHFVWLTCEASRVGMCTSCQALPEGEEMMTCGRCGLVRYCCKDHQRAHWKKHKPRCSTITWDVRPPPPPTSGGLDELD